MGYHRMRSEQLHAIWGRLQDGQSQRKIGHTLGIDRKTVGEYAQLIQTASITADTPYERALEILGDLCLRNGKERPGRGVFEPYEQEIRELLRGSREEARQPMRGTTAWSVIRDKYGLGDRSSYESFKRFVRDRGLNESVPQATVRIEVSWGEEVQVDYAKMGCYPIAGKNRVVYAYLAILSASRLPFVQFTTSQDQCSFATSTVRMLAFYGGSPKRLNLDNLAAGVLKADVHDPVLNRTFAELCDHYGIIADPARVASPKDKGKVERLVQVVRELWKRLTTLHPTADLDSLNELAALWCRTEYGGRKHGTTGIAPFQDFEEYERPALRPLPQVSFEVARWSVAKVHPDQFISVSGKLYGLPATLIGRQVAVKSTASFVEIFFEHKSIRRYAVPTGKRTFLDADFPEYGKPFEKGSFASWLCSRARALGPQAERYITLMIDTGGNLSFRRAQACLGLLEKHRHMAGLSHVLGEAISRRVFIPAQFRLLLETESVQNLIPFPLSPSGAAMAREARYYSQP